MYEKSKASHILYFLSCDCVLDQDHIKKSHKNQITCPHHKGAKVICRVVRCLKCGDQITCGARGLVATMCKSCSREKRLAAARSYSKSYKKATPQSVEIDKTPIREYDCQYYYDCLSAGGRLRADPGGCVGCVDYKQGTKLDVMDYVRSGGKFPGADYCLGPRSN